MRIVREHITAYYDCLCMAPGVHEERWTEVREKLEYWGGAKMSATMRVDSAAGGVLVQASISFQRLSAHRLTAGGASRLAQ